MDLDRISEFVDRFGVSLFVACWFMFRHERLMGRLTTRINKLIISTVVVCKTLDLDEEQERLIRAAADEEDELDDNSTTIPVPNKETGHD